MSAEVAGIIGASIGGTLGVIGVIVGVMARYRTAKAQRETDATSERMAAMGARIEQLERWRGQMEAKYSQLWAYTRELIDYAYRHRRDGAPDLPRMPEHLS